MINVEKSAVYFCKNISREEKENNFFVLGRRQENQMGMYLELLAMIGRSKKKILDFIRERFILKDGINCVNQKNVEVRL